MTTDNIAKILQEQTNRIKQNIFKITESINIATSYHTTMILYKEEPKEIISDLSALARALTQQSVALRTVARDIHHSTASVQKMIKDIEPEVEQ